MIERGVFTGWLWIALWVLSGALVLQGGLELLQLGARWPVWVLSVLPLLVFLVGVAKDNLVWLIWYCLLLLFYFISAVEDTFARPNNVIVVSGLVITVLLFCVCTAYLRFSGREKRGMNHLKD